MVIPFLRNLMMEEEGNQNGFLGIRHEFSENGFVEDKVALSDRV